MIQKKEEIYNSHKAEQFLKKQSLQVSQSQLVQSSDKIKIKPPLVLKIISKQALHKTDIGGVKIVHTQSELEPAYSQLLKTAKKHRIKLEGILAQKYYEGEQLIIGIKKDPVFNHVILFGLGGIFTEVLEDTAIRKCPINKYDVDEMLNELRASKIFHGFRGKKLNLSLLKNTLIKVSELPQKNKKIKELDINPFILNEKNGVIVDARIVFEI
jgi:succinyl-CoA synthetase beta subunit